MKKLNLMIFTFLILTAGVAQARTPSPAEGQNLDAIHCDNPEKCRGTTTNRVCPNPYEDCQAAAVKQADAFFIKADGKSPKNSEAHD